MYYGSLPDDSEVQKGHEGTLSEGYSLSWRIIHGINYIIGGITFVLGSICYYDVVGAALSNKYHRPDFGYVVGAWLYTLGSFTFLMADLQEWWSLRAGCIGPKPRKDDTQLRLLGGSAPERNECLGDASVGINFFLSATGSALYLIGSIGFIPSLNIPEVGNWGFIIGSAFIWGSQAWKVVRQIDETPRGGWDSGALAAFVVDSTAGLGGMCFFIGTIFYNYHTISNTYIFHIWVMGSALFTISGLALDYRHWYLGL